MHIHIKRKHSSRNSEMTPNVGPQSIPYGKQYSFPPNNVEAFKTSNHYAYGVPYRLNTSADKAMNAEGISDKFLDNLRRINEASRLIREFTQSSATESSLDEIVKSFMIQMVCNSFQSKCNLPAKKETLPTGYQILFCETCLSGCILRPTFYPIELEGIAKLDHKCNPTDPSVCKNEEKNLEIRQQVKGLLGDMLSKVVRTRIGQKEPYLKTMMLSQLAFSEEVRRKLKLPANRHLIEEKDCIKINSSCDKESLDHWFCRAIRECDKVNVNYVKITQNELTEFLSITKSTFGVFRVGSRESVKAQYLLIYLVL